MPTNIQKKRQETFENVQNRVNAYSRTIGAWLKPREAVRKEGESDADYGERMMKLGAWHATKSVNAPILKAVSRLRENEDSQECLVKFDDSKTHFHLSKHYKPVLIAFESLSVFEADLEKVKTVSVFLSDCEEWQVFRLLFADGVVMLTNDGEEDE